MNLGVPITHSMTQEDFVKAFEPSQAVSPEDLVRVFEACDGRNEGVLPMESILNDLVRITGSWDSTKLMRMNRLRVISMATQDADRHEQLGTGENDEQENHGAAQSTTRSILVTEVEPVVPDTGCSSSLCA